jgi:hypothetical protein
MDSKRLPAEQAGTALSDMHATDLRAYLDRLIDNLDDSSLRATLKLMICEARGAIRKHQDLIALERLDRRDTAGRTDRLRELETVQALLTAIYARHAESEDEGMDDIAPQAARAQEPVHGGPLRDVPVRASPTPMATGPTSYSFKRFAAATIRNEEGVYVGRISAAALKGELAHAEPPPVRNRQGRHGARPAR